MKMNSETEETKEKQPIATYARTREILQQHQLMAKKGFGQNFLVDPHVMGKIINAANLSKDDTVIEVGPGIGGLTELLAQNAGHVIAYEIDGKMIPVLEENLTEYRNVEIFNRDFLTVDIQSLPVSPNGRINFCANLPYYITTPIIMNILESGVKADMVFMVQKEVGERMKAKPGTKDYGSLSLAVSFYADVSIVANVPRNCFIPRPNVDSAVIKITAIDKPRVEVSDSGLMFRIIKAAFATRRKTLLNCLTAFDEFGMSKEETLELLRMCGLNEQIRGEALELSHFAEITDTFVKLRGV